MQATDKAGKSGNNGDETTTRNFRSSSNFMYMKKYRKGIVNVEPSSSGPQDSQEEPGASAPQANVQPPLPRGPPPPSPPLVKKEVEEEDEYVLAEAEDTDGRTMCRQFARGHCTRGSSCLYTHEIIVSQLPGVYTFCRDFQNSTCSFPRCRFVHATVFEKENFYRTGYLPPHTLAHLKETTQAPPAPPPPPPPPAPSAMPPPAPPAPPAVEGAHLEVPLAPLSGPYPAGPAPPHPGGVMPALSGGEIRPAAAAALGALVAAATAQPFKCDAHINERFRGTLVVAAATRQPLHGKTAFRTSCPNCGVISFRHGVVEVKKEKLTTSIEKFELKTAALEKKKQKQQTLLLLAARVSGSSQSNLLASLKADNTRSEFEKGSSPSSLLASLRADNTRTENEKLLMNLSSWLFSSGSSGGHNSAPNILPSTSAFVPNPSPSPAFGSTQTFPPSFTPGFPTPGYPSNPVLKPTPSYSSASSYSNPTPSYSSAPPYSNPTPSYSSAPPYSNPTPSYSSAPTYSNPTPSYSSPPSYSTPTPSYSLANSTSYSNPTPSVPSYSAGYEEYNRNMNVLARLLRNQPDNES